MSDKPKPTLKRIKYGPHAKNAMDLWIADSSKPTPVVISIHGGGFQIEGGPSASKAALGMMKSGISVIALDYRLSQHAAAPGPFEDVARAVQFVRSRSDEWNLDSSLIAATGNSAGACLALWLGLHADMRKPRSRDPIARESTRLACVAVDQAQTSCDPRFILELMPDLPLRQLRYLEPLFDFKLSEIGSLGTETSAVMEAVSPITHAGRDSCPVLIRYVRGLDAPSGTHHAIFGKALKEKMDQVGVRCEVIAGKETILGSERRTIVRFIKEEFTNAGWAPE